MIEQVKRRVMPLLDYLAAIEKERYHSFCDSGWMVRKKARGY